MRDQGLTLRGNPRVGHAAHGMEAAARRAGLRAWALRGSRDSLSMFSVRG
jgi:hypothetical protein